MPRCVQPSASRAGAQRSRPRPAHGMTSRTALSFFAGNNQRSRVLFPSVLATTAASFFDSARVQKRQDALTDGIQTVKTLDSNPDPLSFEAQPEAQSSPHSSATALFSRNGIAHPASDAGSDEISTLLRESSVPNADEAMTAAESQAKLPPQPALEKAETARPAGRSAADSVTAEPRVDLTGIFRKVQLEQVSESQKAGTQGFTQMFESLSAANGRASSSVPASIHDKAPEVGASAEKKPVSMEQREDVLPRYTVDRDIHQHSAPPPLVQGEFTRLFQRLDHEEPASARSASAHMEERLSTAPSPLGGGFTQLLRTLSAEAEAEVPAFPQAPAPLLPQPSNGPGEFTRIISGSMLREAQGRTGRPEAGAAARPEEAQTPAPQMAVNAAPPAAVPSMAPAMPAAPPAMMFAPQQFVAPPPPPIAAMPLPQITPPPPPPATPANKLQRYIPLLLIANLFLMLLVLILVAFVLLHHR